MEIFDGGGNLLGDFDPVDSGGGLLGIGIMLAFGLVVLPGYGFYRLVMHFVPEEDRWQYAPVVATFGVLFSIMCITALFGIILWSGYRS